MLGNNDFPIFNFADENCLSHTKYSIGCHLMKIAARLAAKRLALNVKTLRRLLLTKNITCRVKPTQSLKSILDIPNYHDVVVLLHRCTMYKCDQNKPLRLRSMKQNIDFQEGISKLRVLPHLC